MLSVETEYFRGTRAVDPRATLAQGEDFSNRGDATRGVSETTVSEADRGKPSAPVSALGKRCGDDVEPA